MSTHRKAKVCPFISESGRMGKLSPRLHTKNWATQPSFQIPLSKIQSLYVKNGNNWPFVLLSSTKVVLEKTLESLLNCKEIQPVHPKGNQSWIFIGRTDAEAETSILWPPDMKNWLIRVDPDAGKDWRQDEKGTTEDEMVGWHHQLNGHEFE